MGKIVLIADSVGASANVALAQRWFQIVALANGWAPADIINSAVPGNKSADMLARIETDVVAHNPDLVVVMPGVNDFANGVPIATYEANYRTMLQRFKDIGAKLVIVTTPIYRSNVASWRPWHAVALKLAAEFKCHLVDVTRAFGWEYVADTATFNGFYVDAYDLVHQNVAGNNKISVICGEPIHAGAFVKDAPVPPPTGCQECPPSSAELQLASQDLLLNGATVARLERLRAALPA